MHTIWAVWAGASVLAFAVLEAYAIKSGQPTLSKSVVDLTQAWPPTAYLFGFVAGALAVHFFWPWKGY